MSERRLQIRYRRPGDTETRDGITWTQHDGPIIVVKSESPRDTMRLAQQLTPSKAIPGGTPIVWLPPGSEFEVWEIDS